MGVAGVGIVADTGTVKGMTVPGHSMGLSALS
jgi:hypothetical protein